MPTDRTDFIGVGFDRLTMEQTLERLAAVTADAPYAYLVTPNVDHMVRLERSEQTLPELRRIYAEADICVCDSRVLARLARLFGIDLPVVTGSDLTRLLFERIIKPGDRVAFVGGDAVLLETFQRLYPAVEFHQHLPPMGLLRNPAAREEAARFIAECKARFSFIAVGSPQQELIAAEVRAFPQARGTALCIGAALEFIAGRQQRAPEALQRAGLEWAHRLASEPRRMWRRYLVEGPKIFQLALRWQRTRSRGA